MELFKLVWKCKVKKQHKLLVGSDGYCLRCGNHVKRKGRKRG